MPEDHKEGVEQVLLVVYEWLLLHQCSLSMAGLRQGAQEGGRQARQAEEMGEAGEAGRQERVRQTQQEVLLVVYKGLRLDQRSLDMGGRGKGGWG